MNNERELRLRTRIDTLIDERDWLREKNTDLREELRAAQKRHARRLYALRRSRDMWKDRAMRVWNGAA